MILTKYIKSGFIGMLLVLPLSLIWAQSNTETPLSLSEALERTVANNQQIKIAKYDEAAAQADVEKMKSTYLPQIETSVTATGTNTPLNAFGTKLQQGAIQQSDFNPTLLNNPESVFNLNTKLMIQQPIINLDARAMKGAVDATQKAYAFQVFRTEKVLRHHVTQAYLQLQLMYEVKEVLMKAKATTEANLKLVQDNFDEGYLQKSDLLAVEVRLNEVETQLMQADYNIQSISDQLSFMMGQTMGARFEPADQLEQDEQAQLLLADLPANRSDVQAMQMQVEARSYMLDASQKASLPRLNVFGSYELNSNLDFDDSQNGYLFGVQASWLIFNGNKNRSTAKRAQLELEKTQTQLAQMQDQNQLEFAVSKRNMLEAQNKINLTQRAIEQSEELLRIKTNRFAEGLEKTTDILVAETNVAQKEMEHAQAVFEYQMAQAELLLMLEQN